MKMPSKKISVKHPKKSALSAPKRKEVVKKLTKTNDIEVNAKLDENKSRMSLYGGTRFSQWEQVQIKSKPQISDLMKANLEKTDLQKAIDEIDSIGSSSELEDVEELKEGMDSDLSLSITEDTKILAFDITSVERSLSGEALASEYQEKFESDNFLIDFGKMPDVEEISLDLVEDEKEVDPQEQAARSTQPNTRSDSGKFLDPVTGLPTLETDVSIKSLIVELHSEEENEIDAEDEIKSEEENETFSLLEDLAPEDNATLMEGDEVVRPSLPHKDQLFGLFLETTKQEESEIKEEGVKEDATYKHEQQKLVAEKAVTDFLNKLIERCVNKAEQEDGEIVLRRSLDKFKLITELKSIYELVEFERSRLRFLNRKAVIFLRRKGSIRLITPDPDKAVPVLRQNFLTALNNLDKWLAIGKKIDVENSNRISELKQQYMKKKHESMEEVNKLEQLISKIFQGKSSNKLQPLVEKLTRKMHMVREEISRARVKLLLEQHQYCSLKKQMEELEDLGNGLTVLDYESLQTETVGISNKIEEHNSTLERLHRQFRYDLHKVAHQKEKENILKNRISTQKQILTECQLKEEELHEHVYHLKLQRKQLKNEANKITHEAGLLSNQELLKDYDETVERANNLRQTNADLKKTIEELNAKIAKFS